MPPVQQKQNITECTFSNFMFWLYKTAIGIFIYLSLQ